MCSPWYWAALPCEEEAFMQHHNEVGGTYVQDMGTKLIRKTLSNYEVKSCIRCENGKIWREYATKRAEIRRRGNILPLTKMGDRLGYRETSSDSAEPETSKLLEFSALTTLDKSVNEVWLFHGTSQDAAKSITKSDFRLPGYGGRLGRGLYFAERASKSHVYSKQNDDGMYVMLLCRVVLGCVLEMEDGVYDPYAENRIIGQPNLDSLLGNPNNARE
eukprot:TRINITY_DN20437_c0_g1_i1.p1 TRINITY_DN20437_c0_g1~~TRINITY_DN20437_c0_g1_i1.p1  ORF type:complete len:217 (-),score=31.44 TRINITY_DN20437_c0_g1_i1:105-755(-)